MTTALARQEPTQITTLDDLQRLAKLLAASNYFDAKGNTEVAVAQVATKILAGQEMGYGPFASVQGIHVIKGRPTLSANLMAAAVKGHPKYDYRVRKMDNEEVVIEFFQGDQSLGISSFSKAEAKAAGTQNMDKFPRNMLFARAMSNGVRWFVPDVFNGNTVYTPEDFDLGETEYRVIDESTGEIHDETLAEIPAIVAEWLNAEQPPKAAQAWAVDSGVQPNEHAARNSMKKIVDNLFGGKLNAENQVDVLLAYHERQQEKLAEQSEATETVSVNGVEELAPF